MTLISYFFTKVTSITSNNFFLLLTTQLLKELGELRGLKENKMAIQFWNYL